MKYELKKTIVENGLKQMARVNVWQLLTSMWFVVAGAMLFGLPNEVSDDKVAIVFVNMIVCLWACNKAWKTYKF